MPSVITKHIFKHLFTNFSSAWTSITFVGDSVHTIKDPDNENETLVEEIPRLLIKSWYPWNAMSGMAYYGSLIYQVILTVATPKAFLNNSFQVYYVMFSMSHANLMDVLFCCWLIFACEQLQHLKEIMKPLMVSSTVKYLHVTSN